MSHQSPEDLTPRELEVAGLVAEFLTDRQIADRLVLSVRTIETHVGHILNKWGCADRRELAREYRRRYGVGR